MAYYHHQVTPFGNLRIKACLPLPEAYRSLSRPSSPVSTKASTLCPLKLDSNVRNQLFVQRTCGYAVKQPWFALRPV
jgi:hypothetical protein